MPDEDTTYTALVRVATALYPDDEYDNDHDKVFALLVDGVAAYAKVWEQMDLERAIEDAERGEQHLSSRAKPLSDFIPRPRWQLTLDAIHDNLEGR